MASMKACKKPCSESSPESASRITYRRLDPNIREIRLLRICPGRYGEVVRCSLSTVPLDERPKFEALSYVWGDAGDTQTIYVDNIPFPATTNLESALRHIREHSCEAANERIPATLDVWVDAICINQFDIEERNQQIRMMKDIYSQASHVLIWLGLGDSHSDFFFDEACNEVFVQDAESALSTGQQPNPRQLRAAEIVTRNLMRRTWWTRVWVVQEVVLARQDPAVLCGSKMCPWSTIVRLIPAITKWFWAYPRALPRSDDAGPLFNPQLKFGGAVSTLTRLRREYQAAGSLGACVPFELSALCDVTDAKDYVYGCFGLLSQEASSDLEVNYNNSADVIYHQATATAFRNDPVWFLGFSIFDLLFWPRCGRAPSWVPDLSQQRFSASSKGWTAHAFHQLGFEQTFGSPSVRLSNNDRILSLAGIRLDVVTELCPLTEPEWLAHLDDSVVDFHDTGHGDPSDLPNDVNHIMEPDSERLGIHIRGIQDAILMFQKTLSKRTAFDGPVHPVMEIQSMEDLFWLFVPREEYTGQDITPEWRSLLWRMLSQSVTEESTRHKWTNPADQQHWRNLRASVNVALDVRAGQMAFVTRIGHMGVSVPVIEVGDVVALIYGMTGPFILRPVTDGTYHMVGFAYVHGFVDPDVLSKEENKGFFEGLETVFDIS